MVWYRGLDFFAHSLIDPFPDEPVEMDFNDHISILTIEPDKCIHEVHCNLEKINQANCQPAEPNHS